MENKVLGEQNYLKVKQEGVRGHGEARKLSRSPYKNNETLP